MKLKRIKNIISIILIVFIFASCSKDIYYCRPSPFPHSFKNPRKETYKQRDYGGGGVSIAPNDTININKYSKTESFTVTDIEKKKKYYDITIQSDSIRTIFDLEGNVKYTYQPNYQIISLKTNNIKLSKRIKKGHKYTLKLMPNIVFSLNVMLSHQYLDVFTKGKYLRIISASSIYTTPNLDGLHYIKPSRANKVEKRESKLFSKKEVQKDTTKNWYWEMRMQVEKQDNDELREAIHNQIVKTIYDTLGVDSLKQYFYHNGYLYKQIPFKSGKENGLYKEYYPNGQLHFKSERKNGYEINDDCNYVSFDRFGDTSRNYFCAVYNNKSYSFKTHYTYGMPRSLMIYDNARSRSIAVAEFTWSYKKKKWEKHNYYCIPPRETWEEDNCNCRAVKHVRYTLDAYSYSCKCRSFRVRYTKELLKIYKKQQE